jgi:hypothetical protein
MKVKPNELKQIEVIGRKYYNSKTVKYYIQHMFKVDDDKRSDYIISILRHADDCFDFVEYTAFGKMIYYTLLHNYDIIQNLHVKVVGNKTSIVTSLLVRYSNTFKSNKKKNLYPKLKIDINEKPPPLEQYRCITPIQKYFLCVRWCSSLNTKSKTRFAKRRIEFQ